MFSVVGRLLDIIQDQKKVASHERRFLASTSTVFDATKMTEELRETYMVDVWYLACNELPKIYQPKMLSMTTSCLFDLIHNKILAGNNPFFGIDTVILDEAYKTTEEHIGILILINEKFKIISRMSEVNYFLISNTESLATESLFTNFKKKNTRVVFHEKTKKDMVFNDSLSIKINLYDMKSALDSITAIIDKEIDQWMHEKRPDHGILILIPGIEEQKELLLKFREKRYSVEQIKISLIHSKIFFHSEFDNQRFNIILSDSVASGIINFPIHSVIISGIQEHEVSDDKQDRFNLPYIMSKNEIYHAQSLIGRPNQPQGKAYCLFSSEEWNNLEEKEIVETTVCDITRLLLTLLMHEIILETYVDIMGSSSRVIKFLIFLHSCKAIDDNFKITEFGRMVRMLPFPIKITKKIFESISKGDKQKASMIIIVSVFLENYELFYRYPINMDSLQTERAKKNWIFQEFIRKLGDLSGKDEMETIINLWWRIYHLHEKSLFNFAKKKSLNSKYLFQCRNKIIKIFEDLNLDLDTFGETSMPFDETDFAVCVQGNTYRTNDGRIMFYVPIKKPKSFPFVIYPLKLKKVISMENVETTYVVACSILYQSQAESSKDIHAKLFFHIFHDFNQHYEIMTLYMKRNSAQYVRIPVAQKRKTIEDLARQFWKIGKCALCCQDADKSFYTLSCFHSMHKSCYNWYKTTNNFMFITCPICQKKNCRIKNAH